MYFAGSKIVQVDRGGYNEGQQVPKATTKVVNAAVEKAVLTVTFGWYPGRLHCSRSPFRRAS